MGLVAVKASMHSEAGAVVDILGTKIDNLSRIELLNQFDSGILVTPNVDHLIRLQEDEGFREAYGKATFRVCDSQIVLLASRFLGTPLRERISGSDFFPDFCKFHADNADVRIFLLGSKQETADAAKARLNARFRRSLVVDAVGPTMQIAEDEAESLAVVRRVNASGATVLAVGLGAPKQEKWIARYGPLMPNVKRFMAIGASIDFEGGAVKRAPRWMSNAGLEWCYRLLKEPKRLWRRYLIEDIRFFEKILRQRRDLRHHRRTT
jgi:N-acetylglucosaminyldiphosphoundecaprenol N-acetyl-beta-D-mannosaminyltransferase